MWWYLSNTIDLNVNNDLQTIDLKLIVFRFKTWVIMSRHFWLEWILLLVSSVVLGISDSSLGLLGQTWNMDIYVGMYHVYTMSNVDCGSIQIIV